jgi:hypothetical protein
MRAKIVIIALVVIIFGSVGTLVAIWQSGRMLPETGTTAALPGTIYFLQRDYQDQLLKLYRQPANLSAPAELVVGRAGCPEQSCSVGGFKVLEDGTIEYTAMHLGEWYVWRGETPVAPAGKESEIPPEPEGATSERGTLVVNGREVLPFTGRYDFKWAPGYQPVAWGPGKRYLIFYYSGYQNSTLGMLGEVTGLGRGSASNYVLDPETGKVVQYPRGNWFIWRQ